MVSVRCVQSLILLFVNLSQIKGKKVRTDKFLIMTDINIKKHTMTLKHLDHVIVCTDCISLCHFVRVVEYITSMCVSIFKFILINFYIFAVACFYGLVKSMLRLLFSPFTKQY